MKQLYQRLPLMLLVLCPFLLQAQLSSITEITLTFTPSSGSAITAKASDADGNGLVVDGPINLSESTDYTLDIELRNIDQNTNITDEVAANPERYQFFFETPGGIIAGDIAYDDTDANSLPVGLANSFTSECVEAEGASGSLRILLSDLMSGKTANSTITDGAAQFDVTWTVNIADAPDAPPCENEEEIITDVILTWTPVGGGDPIVATAKDPDGEGVLDLAVEGPINLLESTEYTLTLTLRNEIEGEDITAEIMEEDDEHMFFFAFTDEVFASPAGDGNVDSRMDPVNYNDQDENGLPVGLSTGWTTECGEENGTGTFRLILKHQPDTKSATSTVDDGGTDLDLTWTVNVAEDPDAPSCENEEEIITDVILTWTPVGGGDPIVATAKDPDGEGVLDLAVEGPINLLESTEYTLTLTLRNEIEGEDITAEIMEEDDEHMFFFAFTDEVFASPAGDGNVDSRMDPVNYNDQDENGLPVGLSTSWTTECGEEDGTGSFRLILKHQPDIKSATSTVDDGGTDVDLTFTVNVAEDPDAPSCENEEEIITDVILTWTPVDGGDPIVATAKDPDGEGVLDLAVEGPINLLESTEYTLSIQLRNEIEGEDITAEIMEEDDEHMFFFAFTDEVFASPAGDGNVDSRMDPVNYNDQDENGLPVGLSTGWTTECGEENGTGTFRLILKHQPDIKSATSTVDDGGTDLDLTWTVNVAEDPDAPSCENEEEIITDVILTWTPVGGGDPIVATAKDPDGEGVLDLAVEGPVNLLESTEYMLSIQLRNEVEGEDITAEIMEEDDEHMFFFAFTDEVFLSPAGDGNVDNREDPVNYNDQDENGLPVGLSTGWTTECGEESASGTFRLILKHQPGIKSATSTVDDGGTDLDLTWTVNVAEDPDAPPCENEEEIITDVTLTWTPVGGGDPIVATAKDPDGEGVLPLAVEAPINLQENTEYTLSLDLRNEIEGESITEEILQEDDEHMFFFGFTEGIFSSPEGDGNIDNRADAVNYNDQDENGLPVGLSTGWTTAATMSGGTFRLILKHQPDIKSETSTVDDGGTDLDLSWVINTDVTDVDDPIEVDKEALVLGPNPVQQELNWKLENASSNDPVDILIFNSSGQLVKRYRSPAPTINVSTLNPGVYIFQLQQEGQVLTKRFVKTQ